MKTYVHLTENEVELLIRTLLAPNSRPVSRKLGRKIRNAVGKVTPCDMELIGADEEELKEGLDVDPFEVFR